MTILISCTNGDPSLSILSSIDGITFSSEKKTSETYTIGTAPSCASELRITGQCDQRFDQLQFSIDGEKTWTRITGYNTDSDGDCVDGEFKLYFPNACTTFNVGNGANEIKKILIRADKNIAQNTTREATVKFTTDVINATRISIAASGLVNEGGLAAFLVTLSDAKAKPVNVDYAVTFLNTAGAATASDFSGVTSGSVTFAPGETSKTITFATVDNSSVCENPKAFQVELSNPSSNAAINVGQASASITDPDRPVISFTDLNSTSPGIAEVTEGGTATVTIALSSVCNTQDVKFNWKTTNGTAVSPGDYTEISENTVTIPKGQSSINLSIPTVQDSAAEASEYFTVVLSNPVDGSLDSGNTANAYIIDDDLPIASINSLSSAIESTNQVFTVTLSSAPTSTAIIYYNFAHVTTSNSDFTTAPATSGFVTISPGSTTAMITYNVFDDTIDEPDQDFTVTLTSVGTTGATISASNYVGTGRIIDNDAAPTLNISVNPTTILESTAYATFTVTPSTPSEKIITVQFSTVDATAVHGEDFTAVTNQTITIPANNTSASQNVAIIDDTIDEPRQYFSGSISSPNNATLGGTTIVSEYLTDNDAEPTATVISTNGTEGSVIPVEVRLSAASQQTFSVDFTSTLVTASNADFSAFANAGLVNFPVNSTSQIINFTTFDDATIEGPETFTVTLSNPQNTFLNSDASGNITADPTAATVTIDDNEFLSAPTLSLSVPSVSPSVSARPTIRASGVVATNEVIIYSDMTCTTQIASATASGTTLDITVPTALAPGAHTFYAKRKDGAIYSLCTASALTYTNTTPSVDAAYPINGANWNDYITYSNQGLKPHSQTDTACGGSELGGMDQYLGCIHGAEKKKMEATGFATCTNLAINESLGAFDWGCENSSGVAVFYSLGLKDGYGLRDLINPSTGQWKPNSITIFYNGGGIASSTLTAWWTNPITILSGPYNNGNTTSVVNLNEAGKIYYIASSQSTFGYSITADKVSLFTAPGSQLTKYEPTDSFNCNSTTGTWNNDGSDNIDTVLCAGNRKYLWIEANLSGDSGTYLSNYGIYATNMKRSQIRSSTLQSFSHSLVASAVNLYNSQANLIHGLTVFNAAGGLLLQTSSYNIVRNLSVANTYATSGSAPSAVEIDGASAEYNRLSRIRISNHGKDSTNAAALNIKAPRNYIGKAIITNTLGSAYTYAIRLGGSTASENVLSQIITAGSSHAAIIFDGGPTKNILNNVTIANHLVAVYFFGGSPTENTFTSFAVHNVHYGFYTESSVPAGPLNNFIQDVFISNHSTSAFSLYNSGFATGGGYLLYDVGSSCGTGYGSLFCSTYGAVGVANLTTGGYTGPITVDDTINPQDTNGAGTFSVLTADGMLKFDNWARGWGKDYSISDSNAIGNSDTGVRIWDFNAVANGKISDRSGNAVALNSSLVLNGADCGSNTVNSAHLTFANGISFYRNAVEIDGDGVGNDNGLCESGDYCYYLPNIGGSQPDGARSTNFCTVDSSIRLYTRGP